MRDKLLNSFGKRSPFGAILNFYWFKIYCVGINKYTRFDVVKNYKFIGYRNSFWNSIKLGINGK